MVRRGPPYQGGAKKLANTDDYSFGVNKTLNRRVNTKLIFVRNLKE